MNDFLFEPRTTKFSEKNALCCARASKLAYEDEDKIHKKITKWGFEQFEFFDCSGTQAFIAAKKEMILVAFRGTEPTKIQDLAADADLRMTAGPGGEVHSGFLRALERVMGDIQKTIKKYKEEYFNKLGDDLSELPPSLWFTGHSLGAGLATLAVAKMRIEGKGSEEPIHGLYTFGSPRVGDKEFSEKFDANFKEQTFRVVNNNDVVTRIPIRVHGYRHIGQFFYITVNGELDDDIGWWRLKLDRIKGRMEDFGHIGPDGLNDHSMENGYVPKLTEIEKDKNLILF